MFKKKDRQQAKKKRKKKKKRMAKKTVDFMCSLSVFPNAHYFF